MPPPFSAGLRSVFLAGPQAFFPTSRLVAKTHGDDFAETRPPPPARALEFGPHLATGPLYRYR